MGKNFLLNIFTCCGFVIASASLTACSYVNTNLAHHETEDVSAVCTPWAEIPLGKYVIINNVWGKGNISDYSQCVFHTPGSIAQQPESMGWFWNWPTRKSGVKAYPSILYGRKPWNRYSTIPQLPAKIDQLNQLTASYYLEESSNGAVNLLLESWITQKRVAVPSDRTGELAIHLYQKNWPAQAGDYIESIVFDGIKYDFYIEKTMRVPGDNHSWTYYGFVHKGPPLLMATVDMMKFINYLVARGYVNQEHYIASVELGNEIDHGKGKTRISRFNVNVNSTN